MSRTLRSRALSNAAFAALIGTCAIAAVVGRVVHEGERELRLTDAAIVAHDAAAAAAHGRSSASWYVPFAPHVAGAYRRLTHVARTSEAFGDREAALFAWRSIRSAAITTRWVAQPFDDELAHADHAIARLESDMRQPPLAAPQQTNQSAIARGRSQLGWSIALVLGLTALVGAAVLAARALRSSHRSHITDAPQPASARLVVHYMAPAALALAGLAVYALGLYFA